jgi:oxalate decarboxylase/phosphoglucose isomerase-like protein (cupin superfamily)
VKPQGGVPFSHSHTYQKEMFTVISGEVKFTLDGKESIAKPGETIRVPRGATHTCFNPSTQEDMKLLVEYRPARFGDVGLEQIFGLAKDGKCSKEGAPFPLLMAVFMVDSQFEAYLGEIPKGI